MFESSHCEIVINKDWYSSSPRDGGVRYAVNRHESGGNLCDSQTVVIRNKNIDYVIDNFIF